MYLFSLRTNKLAIVSHLLLQQDLTVLWTGGENFSINSFVNRKIYNFFTSQSVLKQDFAVLAHPYEKGR